MKPNVEKIVAVWEKEPGLCYRELAEVGPIGQRQAGCAVGSLLWATDKYENAADLVDLDPELGGNGERERDARALLDHEYGLAENDFLSIIDWNDCFGPANAETTEQERNRRDYMIAKVREEWGTPDREEAR